MRSLRLSLMILAAVSGTTAASATQAKLDPDTCAQLRLEQIKFLNVTTSMLPSGIAFPVIPESTEIMNIIVPEMMQNALTRKMTVAEATADAHAKIERLLDGI